MKQHFFVLIILLSMIYCDSTTTSQPNQMKTNARLSDHSEQFPVKLVCHLNLSTAEIREIISRYRCLQIDVVQKFSREKRSSGGNGFIEIGGQRTTIEDHRNIVNYMINNSIDSHFYNSFVNQHATSLPNVGSWRDCLLILNTLHLMAIVFFVCFRSKWTQMCDAIVQQCCHKSINRIQQKSAPNSMDTISTIAVPMENMSSLNRQTNQDLKISRISPRMNSMNLKKFRHLEISD